ncbi:MAG: glycosyltransferase family 4 protein [Ferruginibacter sp.]
MANQTRILFGIITKSHTELALDEMYGFQDLGYSCDKFEYGANKNIDSSIGRLLIVLLNAFKLLVKTYRFNPHFIYLNSRLEYIAGTRDFITILLIKTFYYKKIDFILKSHGSDLEVLTTKKIVYSKIIFPFLNNHIRGWLFLSTEEIKWINSKNLIHEERIFLAKNIVRNKKFVQDPDFKKKFNINSDYKILLYVGRLLKQKGIHDVIDAFAEIDGKYKIVLIVVGDGEEFESIQEKIEKLGIKKNIILTGWVNEKEAAYYTSNSDILVFPTYYPEGFPMVVFNSLAAGLAIITTPTRAAIDYLNQPANCIWVESQNKTSIISAISKLLNDDPLTKQMRSNNIERSTLFTKEIVAKELSSIVKAIESNTYRTTFIEIKDQIEHSKQYSQ